MKKIIACMIIMLFLIITLTGCKQMEKTDSEFTIVTSFYPMYIIAKNLVQGIPNIEVNNMADQSIGCLHDYTLKTSDLVKIEKADVFIINGLGIENFTTTITDNYPEMKIINASSNITNLIKENNITNAHVWLDIENYMKQIENIANKLASIDEENSSKYLENSQIYQEKIKELSKRIKELTKQRKKCVSFSESLEYLSNSMNLEIKTITVEHEHNGISAEKLSDTIEYIKNNNIKNIILDENTPDNNAQAIASETNAKIYIMKAGLSGNDDLNSYVDIMNENLKQVEKMEV